MAWSFTFLLYFVEYSNYSKVLIISLTFRGAHVNCITLCNEIKKCEKHFETAIHKKCTLFNTIYMDRKTCILLNTNLNPEKHTQWQTPWPLLYLHVSLCIYKLITPENRLRKELITLKLQPCISIFTLV